MESVEEPEQEPLTAAEKQQEIEFDKFVTRASEELEACRVIVSRPSEDLNKLDNQLILLHVWKQLEQITDHSLNLLAVEYAGRGRCACAVGVAGLR